MVNEGIFDTVTDVLQSEDKMLVLTGYSNLDLHYPFDYSDFTFFAINF